MSYSKKIGIDARLYNESGIGRYIRNLLKWLQVADKENEYFVFLRKNEYESLKFSDNFHKVLCDIAWYGLGEQIKLPGLLNKFNLDLVHFPHFNVPILYRKKFIVTIHDLIHQHFAMKRATTHGNIEHAIKQFGYNTIFKSAIIRSEKIFVPSEFVKQLLISDWKVKKDKVLVTPEAVDEEIVNISKKITKSKSLEIVRKMGVEFPYIFYLGNAHPHKNLERLISVFHKLNQKYQQLHLVLSGHNHYFWERIKKESQSRGLDRNVIFTGYITDEQAVSLYKNAVCYVLPSLEEGFGIPLLEAMACGCPVVSANSGSLPEIGKGACLYFNPRDENDIYTKVEQVLNSEKIRLELIKKGNLLYKEFDWMKLSKQTLEAYNQCV